MARKYKMTGCARIFIVLIIITPIAFFAASYINNSDPVETLSEWFGKKETPADPAEKEIVDSPVSEKKPASEAEEQIERLKKDLEYYKREAERLREQLEECEEEHSR